MSKTLINFRCPDDVIDTFDETCRFKNMNRTQTLIELMRIHVIEKQEEIKNWNTLYEMTGEDLESVSKDLNNLSDDPSMEIFNVYLIRSL